MRKFLGLLALLAAAGASPARAEWREARTDHFVLTIDSSEEEARDFATRLERFDAALRLLYGVQDSADQRARPIMIYALREEPFMFACRCPGTLGKYVPRVEGSYIFSMHAPAADRKAKIGSWSSQALLLHEYSHHFMYSHFPVAYPFWFSEGFAEFNANTSFEPDGSLIIGYPANYRAEGVANGISMKKLLDPQQYGFVDNPDVIYGRGWLLTHYLMLDPARRGQLSAYLNAMNRGVRSVEAAQTAFGDLGKLEDELEAYRKGKLLAPFHIPAGKAPIKVTLRTLSPGEAAMVPLHAFVMDSFDRAYRLRTALDVAKVADRYRDDAVVQAQQAETEYLAERFDQADAAADRALALRPDLIEALDAKGRVAVARLARGKSTDAAAWTAGRAWFLKANHLNPDAVMPLYLYYSSFVAEKAKPTPGAVKALMRAQVLAPESVAIRMALARHMLLDGKAVDARALLQPVAFAPHRARDKNVPRNILELIDAGKIDEARALIAGNDKDGDDD